MASRVWAVGQVFEVTDETAQALVMPLQVALEAEECGPDGHLLEDYYVEAGAELREQIGSALALLVLVEAGDRRRGRAAGRRVVRRVFHAAACDPCGPLSHLSAVERDDVAEALYESAGARLVVDEESPVYQLCLGSDL